MFQYPSLISTYRHGYTDTRIFIYIYIGMHTHTVQYMNPHLVPGHTGLSQWGFFAFERDGGESEKKKERERFQVKTV